MSVAKCETGWGDLSTRALLDVERPSPHPAAHFMSVDPRASFARLGPLKGRVKDSVPALQPTHMLLGVELKPDASDQIELGFEEVDVMLLVLHQALEQVA